jgi:hypothetical protein
MKKILYLSILLVISAHGFTQFHISKESLIEQFKGSSKREHIFVRGNDLAIILCLDKNERQTDVPVNNRTGIRIFLNDKSKKTFYFNTVVLTDSTIGGSKTHFFNAQIKPIRFSDISKIEILK